MDNLQHLNCIGFVIRSNAHLLYNSIMCGGVGSSCSIERGYLDGMVSAYVSLIEKNTTTNTLHSVLPQPNYHINNTNDTIGRKYIGGLCLWCQSN